MIAQRPVRLSLPPVRKVPPISQGFRARLDTMKDRFPIDRRPAWRQRFLAIARELEAAPARRDSLEAARALRRPLRAGPVLRGIRMGCIRTA